MILLLLLISLATPATASQLSDSIPPKNRNFYTSIVTNAAQNQTGYLYDINDSAISITNMYLPEKTSTFGIVHTRTYKYADINYVKMKRRNSVGRGALFGGLIGFGTGALIGLASGDDPKNEWFAMTAGEKALGLGVFMGTTGTLAGLIIGAVAHKKFTINGNREKFHAMKTDLLHRANEKPTK